MGYVSVSISGPLSSFCSVRQPPAPAQPFVAFEHAYQTLVYREAVALGAGYREAEVELTHLRCAGIDVHKKLLTVCLRVVSGGTVRKQVREFGTTTRDLLELSDWLSSESVEHVAMESTGAYWKPVYNILEGTFQILLANARHMRNVPGRKTDVKDAEWIAELHAHGLLSPSFVPSAEQRGIRELTRTRTSLVGERSRLSNRIQKILEDANVKLGSVASDVLGVSGRDMLQSIIQGEEDPKKIAELARRSLRKKIPQLELALEGRVRPHHRVVLKELMANVESLDRSIANLNAAIESAMEAASDPFETAVQLIDTAPGAARVSARAVAAEIGTNMAQFPTQGHIASWAGICPGNRESAGKRKSGRTTAGNRWLKATLIIMAHAAIRDPSTYLHALYRRKAASRGKKRAIVAVAHSLLVSIYHMLKNGVAYQELGAEYFDRQDKARTVQRLQTRLQNLGYTVQLTEVAA